MYIHIHNKVILLLINNEEFHASAFFHLFLQLNQKSQQDSRLIRTLLSRSCTPTLLLLHLPHFIFHPLLLQLTPPLPISLLTHSIGSIQEADV